MEGGKHLGMLLMIAGVILAGAGAALLFFDKIPFLGRLPGDFAIKRGNFRLFIPITTSIIISLLLTLAFWLVEFLRRK